MPDLASTKLVELNVLHDGEALKLFARVVGEERPAAEPEATALRLARALSEQGDLDGLRGCATLATGMPPSCWLNYWPSCWLRRPR